MKYLSKIATLMFSGLFNAFVIPDQANEKNNGREDKTNIMENQQEIAKDDSDNPSTPKAMSVYRAVLVGNNNYPPETAGSLSGCINDVTCIKQMLEANVFENGESFSKINLVPNATRQMIINAINTTFAGATNNDVSYFAYSGHGAKLNNTSYLCTVDATSQNWLSVDDLEALLRTIPGRIVILLDSCHSGGFINKSPLGDEKEIYEYKSLLEQENEVEEFNDDVISAFSAFNDYADSASSLKAKDFLVGNKYRVITACSKDEVCFENNNSAFGKPMGQFTSNLLIGCGHPISNCSADTNGDRKVNLTEAYTYTKNNVFGSSVKASPEISCDVLFQYPSTPANGIYRIRGLGSCKYVDVKNANMTNGVDTQIWEEAYFGNQLFKFERLPDNSYKITAIHSKKSLTVPNNGKNNCDPIVQWDFDANYAGFRWYIINCGNGYCKLVNKNSGKVLDVVGNGTTNGTRIWQYEDNGTSAQRFRLIPESANLANPVLTVYEHINCGGFSRPYYASYATLSVIKGNMGIANDTISSIVVHQPIRVRLFEHDYQGPYDFSKFGKYLDFPMGKYNLTDFSFNDIVSRIEIYPYDFTYAYLYRDINENWGNSVKESNVILGLKIPSQVASIVNIGWNDRASSVYVPYGKSVTLYQHINYGGKKIKLYTGVHNLTSKIMEGNISWNDQVSSYITE